ncbi:MAG: hypothetical protein FWG94_03445 [Oscillospiraceae bacterium]|nr:hypothetical protein [Oscillospiraceae bacterium]
MARVDDIKIKLAQYSVNDERIMEITGSNNLINVIDKMEECLTLDIMQQIMDSFACGGGDDFEKACEELDKHVGGKTLNEKLNHLVSISDNYENITINADKSLTVTWSFVDNGKYICQCPVAIQSDIKVSELALENNIGNVVMPLSYCFCCAGSCRRHFQLQNGIKLRTKKIISSPINSKGEKPCSFIFEVEGI